MESVELQAALHGAKMHGGGGGNGSGASKSLAVGDGEFSGCDKDDPETYKHLDEKKLKEFSDLQVAKYKKVFGGFFGEG